MKQWIVLGITLSCFGLLSACQESSPVANNEAAATARDLPVLSFDQPSAEVESPADESAAISPTTTLEINNTVHMTKTAEPVEAERTNVSGIFNATYQQRTENQATYTATANNTISMTAEARHQNEDSIEVVSIYGATKEPYPAKDSNDTDDDD